MKKEKKPGVSRRDFITTSAKATAASAIAVSGFPTIVPSSVFGQNAPSNKINVAQIGIGRIARGHDLPCVFKCDDARVIALADYDGARQVSGKKFIEDAYAKKTGQANYVDVKMYDNYQELLTNKDIDAVMISTPDHWHAQVAIEAALAGKHIYCQKPTSLTIEEGRKMSDIIRKTNVVFQLGSQQRSADPWPQFKKACELVRNGRIGTLKTVRVGLPGDPAGGDAKEMPVPDRFNYDAWLGSTPYIYYTLDRVHSTTDVNSRPGWLRLEQFGAGMITGWGVHHIDIAHWGMNTEYTGPVEAEATVDFPKAGLWNVHGDFEVNMKYANGVTMVVNGKYQNGIKFEGTKGWIFCTRSGGGATASDPKSNGGRMAAFDASDKKILESVIGPNETHLYDSPEQHRNWLDSIKNKKPNISPIEVAHRSCSACLVAHAAMKFPGQKLYWDPTTEKFKSNVEANKLLSRPQRYPYGTNYIKVPKAKV
ncbi:Gfo/Idh/MocA family oxidoreductase [Sediminibacterium roseum]|uniref:Gfo/Idh/MocA family oxidoreductase n=1 Tax=Sediminibacterium roseum TaxID=1978412 RepID=A0ABW9ZW86_9BACT|nr:Gfo/Idh/MocA family oxidoreductase [Sediminibacterium roseum]NCI51422.1 Gfo/Idh/MocA family oxidoreductase [Sediminibacterium roseum]